jgi:C-terminal processing protease CtpA/Prc
LLISTQLYYRSAGKPLQDQNLRNSGVTPDVRSPDEDFVTNFYFENVTDDTDKGIDEEFYRKLNSAVDAEQFRSGLKYIREKVVKKAA